MNTHRDDGPHGSLIAREREVLALMAEGRTNGSIAGEFVVSEAAVRKHIGNIFAELPSTAAPTAGCPSCSPTSGG